MFIDQSLPGLVRLTSLQISPSPKSFWIFENLLPNTNPLLLPPSHLASSSLVFQTPEVERQKQTSLLPSKFLARGCISQVSEHLAGQVARVGGAALSAPPRDVQEEVCAPAAAQARGSFHPVDGGPSGTRTPRRPVVGHVLGPASARGSPADV